MDLQKWMTRFQRTGNRLIESWMGLLPEPSVTNPESNPICSTEEVNEIRQRRLSWQQQHQVQLLK